MGCRLISRSEETGAKGRGAICEHFKDNSWIYGPILGAVKSSASDVENVHPYQLVVLVEAMISATTETAPGFGDDLGQLADLEDRKPKNLVNFLARMIVHFSYELVEEPLEQWLQCEV